MIVFMCVLVCLRKQAGKRSLGAYFRVTFFGTRFEDLDGKDFIYKERPHTGLAAVCGQFEVSTLLLVLGNLDLSSCSVQHNIVLSLLYLYTLQKA